MVKIQSRASREFWAFLWKGEVLAYVGRNKNLKNLKDHTLRKQGVSADPFYGRARCSPMLGSLKT